MDSKWLSIQINEDELKNYRLVVSTKVKITILNTLELL